MVNTMWVKQLLRHAVHTAAEAADGKHTLCLKLHIPVDEYGTYKIPVVNLVPSNWFKHMSVLRVSQIPGKDERSLHACMYVNPP